MPSNPARLRLPDRHWRAFQSVERICVPSNPIVIFCIEAFGGFQSVERICVPSNPTKSCSGTPCSLFQSVERICVPSNSGNAAGTERTRSRFNPSNGFVCLRTPTDRGGSLWCDWFQSVERICVPSNAYACKGRKTIYLVSIRRTDLCAFEHRAGLAPY